MKYFIKPLEASGEESKKDSITSKLYIAYINREAVNDPDDLYSDEKSRDSRSYKASAFVSSGEMMPHTPIPFILSHDEEMMLFDEEY